MEGRHVLYKFLFFFFDDHNKFAPADYQVVLALMFASRYELYGTGLKVLDTVIRLDPSDRVDARTVRLGVSRIDLREKESFRHALFEGDFYWVEEIREVWIRRAFMDFFSSWGM